MASSFLYRLSIVASILGIAGFALAERIVLVAGGDKDAVSVPATDARLKEPFGTDFDAAGNLWIIEMESGGRLLKVDPAGLLTHVAGKPKTAASGQGGPGLQAIFRGAHNLVVMPSGKILVADTFASRLDEVDPRTGDVTDSPLQKPATAKPFCVTLDPKGQKIYMVDLTRAYEIDVVSYTYKVIAGNGKKGVPQDGAVAINAPLVDPRAIAPDHQGNVYILERNGNALRVVDRLGHIRTVVNGSGKKGATGDGGPALQATMNGPKHLCVDADDSVIIADAENNIVRRYTPKDGMLTRVAGTGGKAGNAGVGGDPKQCQLYRPHGVTVNAKTGELYITDSYNNRVLKIVKE